MDSKTFQAELKKDDGPALVYKEYLMDQDVHIFDGHGRGARAYHEFRVMVSRHLDVAHQDVAIVGSAKMGFSLAPAKRFRAFNPESDIDLVIVSRKLFESLWKRHFDLRSKMMGASTYRYGEVAKEVFRHFVSVSEKGITFEMRDHFKDWLELIDELKKAMGRDWMMDRDINYRVYESWEYVERYHVDGLVQLARECQ